MLTSGDVVLVDLGVPEGSEAGLRRPAIVVTSQQLLGEGPSVVQIVPLTGTVRGYASEVAIDPDPANGLEVRSAAQCQHIRGVATRRLEDTVGNVGPVVVAQVRNTLALLLDC